MILALIAALLTSSRSEIPPDAWLCHNQLEVWCTVDSCAAKPAGEMTPLRVWARRDGAFSICAYTGCWEGRTTLADANGRLLWAADGVAFSSSESGYAADVSLLIVAKEGVGFVRVGALATPLLCVRTGPGKT